MIAPALAVYDHLSENRFTLTRMAVESHVAVIPITDRNKGFADSKLPLFRKFRLKCDRHRT